MNIIVKIRRERKEDKEGVYFVNELAFEHENESILVDSLRQSEFFVPKLSLVAEKEGEIIGHILFTKIKIIDEAKVEYHSLSLAPMSVRPSFQNLGVGTALVKSGLEIATKLGFESVIVLGHDKYYPRFGFKPASKWNITCPYEVPDEVFMALELVPGALKNVSGKVRYPKEFDEV